MTWSVKEDFYAEGATFSPFAQSVCHIYPSVHIETSRELTSAERRRVYDALVKAASVEMMKINEEENDNGKE